MTEQTSERALTDAEKAQLQRILQSVPDEFARLKTAARQGVVVWAFGSLAVAVLWLVLAAVVQALAGPSFGWNSPYVVHGVAASLLVSGALAIVSISRWLKMNRSLAPVIRADLVRGLVRVEEREFSEARRFQEPEHGGLIYFLKAAGGPPYVMFDAESQELGVRRRNPLDSSFAPRTRLQVVRVPASRLVLSSEFSGDALPLAAPVLLAARPADWPQDDADCPVDWDALDARYARSH